MKAVRGVEVGNIFKLGTRYSEAVNCTFLDKDGKKKLIVMGSYGIGSGRLLACIAEEHHDKDGLIWPISVAPYHLHLVAINETSEKAFVKKRATQLYHELREANIEVLFDDREEKPGVKFKDADLIGLPIRLTVSPRSLEQGGAELKYRDSSERVIIGWDEVVSRIVSKMKSEL